MTCPDCHGTSVVQLLTSTKPCPTCLGTGNVADAGPIETLFGYPVKHVAGPVSVELQDVATGGSFVTGTVDLVPASPTPTPLPSPILGPSPLCAALPAVGMAKDLAEEYRRAMTEEATRKFRDEWLGSFSGARRGCIVPAPDPTLGVAASASSPARVSLDISLECDADNADTLIEMLKGPRFVLHGLQTRTMPRWTPPATEEPMTKAEAVSTITEFIASLPEGADVAATFRAGVHGERRDDSPCPSFSHNGSFTVTLTVNGGAKHTGLTPPTD